jgi:hypothetical protein
MRMVLERILVAGRGDEDRQSIMRLNPQAFEMSYDEGNLSPI